MSSAPLGSPRRLGNAVRDARTRLGLTQAALAETAGVSRAWLVSLERGNRRAELGLVLQTVDALGMVLRLDDDTEVSEAERLATQALRERGVL